MAKKKAKPEGSTEELENEAQTEQTEQAEKTEQTEKAQQQPEQGDSGDRLAELEAELEAAKQAHIRTLAEYDNYRKRTAKEKAAAYSDAKADCLTQLLPAVDNFERALSASAADADSFKKGVEMIYSSIIDTMGKLGVESFGQAGDKFDPNLHNGVMHIDDDSLEENTIAEVFSKGYKLGDKILRPAMVKVAN